jgi:O-antigen/teichoic acid export membrane protein
VTTAQETPALTVARGARVNGLGVVARLAQPLALVLLTRWYGPEEIGVYLLSVAVVETLAALAGSGLQDAVVAFLSPLDPSSPRAQSLLASAFALAAAGSVLAVVLALGGAVLAPAWLPQVTSSTTLLLMAPAVPLMVFTGLVVAATRSRFVQAWDVVLMGVTRPVLVIGCAAAFLARGATAGSLALAYLTAHASLAAVAAFVLARHYAWLPVLRAARPLRIERSLLAFAWPQNLNLALYALSGSASVLALGVAGLSPREIALFGAAFAIASSLRHVRLVFTSAMAPVAAALLARHDRAALQEVMTRATRWTLSLALPIATAMILLRNPLLAVFHPTYSLGALTMGLLVVGPVLNTVAGFASNALVMAGRVGWNLANTAVAVGTTFGLTTLLAPSLGIAGAALAAALSGTVVSALQIAEARHLLGVTPRLWKGTVAGGR